MQYNIRRTIEKQKLYHIDIEKICCDEFDLGLASSSNVPHIINSSLKQSITICGTKKSETFFLEVYKANSNKYEVIITL